MRELVVLSGKGGTGKTTVCGSLAVLAPGKVLADCDVDAANLYLLLDPVVKSASPFYGLKKATINREKCLGCNLCLHLCRYDAIRPGFVVDPVLCEGCALCYHACPCGAVEMVDHVAGHLFHSETIYGPLVHARLGIAEDNSGKLVAAVRKEARRLAEEEKKELIITDGPPGIGCPVISCLSGTDLVLVVTEPTFSGKHDLERVLDLAEHFGCRAAVCVNKWDLEPENTRAVESLCNRRRVPVVGHLPYDESAVEAVKRGRPVILECSRTMEKGILALWDQLKVLLN
ncbi:ATP-binding protein [Desulfofundulus thermocisternus]|uniref:ATP-binding protein n=1 Tax=Desulfofundulus thermocisternus TaxID=42471 RepID=UPI0019F83FA1|nr:ATP-binding protein [Desulfofundulus thermocisternus]MBE3584651.1 ATP-binding protein [Thermoanaerobacter sp.]MCS5694746.1 ATP-binding protein [Desulfofundulus thermocisternus]